MVDEAFGTGMAVPSAGPANALPGVDAAPYVIDTALGAVEIDLTPGEGPVILASGGVGGVRQARLQLGWLDPRRYRLLSVSRTMGHGRGVGIGSVHHGWRLVQDERRDLALFFRGLTPEQWEEASLCAGWRIRDVAAHLLIDEPVQAGAVRRVLPIMARHGFSIDRINSSWAQKNLQRTPESIVQSFLEDSASGVGLLGHLLGPAVALRALVVHHQDMRRPLNLGRAIPPDRLVAVLDGLMSLKGTVSIGSRERAKGLRLRASDVDWLRGEGPEVRGPGEAIVMALAGRKAALPDLEGDGKEILGRRMP